MLLDAGFEGVVRKYLALFLPLGACLGLAAVWLAAGWPAPVLYLRADLISLLIALGVAGSLGWALALLWRRSLEQRAGAALAAASEAQAEQHRRFLRRLDHELKNPLTAMRAGLANVSTGAALRQAQGPDALRQAQGPEAMGMGQGEGTDESVPGMVLEGGDAPGHQGGPNGRALASVRAQVDRLARLSADLRKLAELETQPIERAPVQPAELLAEVVDLAGTRPAAEDRRLRLNLPSAPWPLPDVAGDRDLLFLAVHNLLDNALKFTHPGDTIEVRAFEDGAWVAIEVADTGPGIPEDELPHLGEELYRGAAARAVEGSGLGLALVRAIVACHGGAFGVRSRQGQGTVVTLRLPAGRSG